MDFEDIYIAKNRILNSQLEELRVQATELNQVMKDQAQQYLEEDDCCAGAPVMEEELPRDTPDQLKKKQAVTKEALLRSSYPVHTKCTKCKDALRHFSVFCKTCKGQLCSYCDLITHYLEPLHERRLLLETTFEEVKVFDVHSLLPTTFVDSWGETFSIEVPVPCLPPTVCPICLEEGVLLLCAGKRKLKVIILRGRFDISSAAFACQNPECYAITEATTEDYVSSQWWCAAASSSSYLFGEDLFESYYNLKNLSPGMSESAFVEHLECLSAKAGRKSTISRLLFNKTFKFYEHTNHSLETEILRQAKTCDACDEKPHSGILDGIMKLKRYHKNRDTAGDVSLYQNELIASDDDVRCHTERINSAIGSSGGTADTCGGFLFKAASESEPAGRAKKLDERGLVVACCRHNIIYHAANIYRGENFRLIHYMHQYLSGLHVDFVCYDVICAYWEWAVKLSVKIPEFRILTENMTPFLSRMHAVAHIWYCYILWVGHWRDGAAATIGEEMEQVNADIARLANTSKHMTKAGRTDHITGHFFYWNVRKDKTLPKILSGRLWRARLLYPAYKEELQLLLQKDSKTEDDLPSILQEVVQRATEAKGASRSRKVKIPIEFHMRSLEGLYVELCGLRKMYAKSADSSKAKIHASSAMTKTKKKAEKVIKIINSLHLEESEKSLIGESELDPVNENDLSHPAPEQLSLESPEAETSAVLTTNDDGRRKSTSLVTMEEFLDGEFPWQTGDDKDGYRRRHFILDTWKLRDRYLEEIALTEKEMMRYVLKKKQTLDSLEVDVAAYCMELKDATTVLESESSLRGKIALVRSEIRRVKGVIRSSAALFQGSMSKKLDDPSDWTDTAVAEASSNEYGDAEE